MTDLLYFVQRPCAWQGFWRRVPLQSRIPRHRLILLCRLAGLPTREVPR